MSNRRVYYRRNRVGLPARVAAAAATIQQAWRRFAPVREQRKRFRQEISKHATSYQRAVSKPYKAKRQRVMTKRFFTVGKLGRKFKKLVKADPSRFLRYGVVNYVETGGTQSSTDCPYVGHAFGVGQIFGVMVDAVVHRLFKKAGCRITTMKDDTSITGDLQWTYKTNLGTPLSTRIVTVSPTQSISDVSAALKLDIETYINGSASVDDFAMFDIVLVDGTTTLFKRASLNFEDMQMTFDCSSSMAVQNRSLADTTGADPANQNEVTNNPIGGRLYEGRGTGSAFKLQDNALTIGGTLLTADRNAGDIKFDINATNVSASMQSIYRRPQPGSSFARVSKSSMVALKPGQIRNSRLYYRCTHQWNYMIKMLWLHLKEAGNTNQYLPIGYFRFFAFEKKCNTQAAGEQSIDLGYEINSVYRCMVKVKSNATAPTVTVI